jgi:hypothetical protein
MTQLFLSVSNMFTALDTSTRIVGRASLHQDDSFVLISLSDTNLSTLPHVSSSEE